MDKDLQMNYLTLALSSLVFAFMCFIYVLLGENMLFALKVGYGVISVITFALIIFNVITIIKKVSSKSK